MILIQDAIMNLTVEAEKIATVFTEDTKVFWNISQGIQGGFAATLNIWGYKCKHFLSCLVSAQNWQEMLSKSKQQLKRGLTFCFACKVKMQEKKIQKKVINVHYTTIFDKRLKRAYVNCNYVLKLDSLFLKCALVRKTYICLRLRRYI